MTMSRTYFGLDLGNYYSQLSYYTEGMAEPVSISTIVGSEKYLIPTVIGKKSGYMQWYVGEEATKMPLKVEQLLQRAMKREQVNLEGDVFSAIDLLAVYIRRILQLASTVCSRSEKDVYVICIDHASQLAVETLLEVCGHLGIDKKQVKICSRQECFCYYVMNQEGSVRIHDVILLDYWKDTLKVFQLQQDKRVEPNVVSVRQMQVDKMAEFDQNTHRMTAEELGRHKDACLYDALDEILGQSIVSSMYLVGDGFDGDWMERSISRMCAGRRVFGGKNLYTKGACYYGKISAAGHLDTPEYLYLGGGNILANVCIKAKDEGAYTYKVLVPAGYNWQDANGQLEILIRDIPTKGEEHVAELPMTLEILIRTLKGEEKKEILELKGLMTEGDIPIRLRVTGRALSTSKVKITVEDLGFGQIHAGSHKMWEAEYRLVVSE